MAISAHDLSQYPPEWIIHMGICLMNFNKFLRLIPALSQFASDSSSSSSENSSSSLSSSSSSSGSSATSSSSSMSTSVAVSPSASSGEAESEFDDIGSYSSSSSSSQDVHDTAEYQLLAMPKSIIERIFHYVSLTGKLHLAATNVNFRRILIQELFENIYTPIKDTHGIHKFHLSLDKLYRNWLKANPEDRQELERILQTRRGFRVLWGYLIDGQLMDRDVFDSWLGIRNAVDVTLEMLTFVLDHGRAEVSTESIKVALKEEFDVASLRLLLTRLPDHKLYDTDFIMSAHKLGAKDHLLIELTTHLLGKQKSCPHLVDFLLKFGGSNEKIVKSVSSFPPGNKIGLSEYAIKKISASFSDDEAILFFSRFPDSRLLNALSEKHHVSLYLRSEIKKILKNSSTWCQTSMDLCIGIQCSENDHQVLKLVEAASTTEGLKINARILDLLIKGRFEGDHALRILELFPNALFTGGRVSKAIKNCSWPHRVNLAIMSRTPSFKLTPEIASHIRFNECPDELVIEYAKYIESPLVALRFALMLTKSHDALWVLSNSLQGVKIGLEEAQLTICLALAHSHPTQNIDLVRDALLCRVN